MEIPIYFYLALGVMSPWPIFYSFLFYYMYKFDTTFEYYISKPAELYKIWIKVLFLPIIISSIFMLRYRRMGLSFNLFKLRDLIWEIIYPFSPLDLVIFVIFISLFVIMWILALRVLYQTFRKCILALYLYYYQYDKFKAYYRKVSGFSIDYDSYLWNRVKIFTPGRKAFNTTWFLWPTCTNIIEKNLFHYLVFYLVVFDSILYHGVLTKIFLVLPWYYIYSLLRFGLIFFFTIHKPENWNLAKEMYETRK